MTTTSDSRHVFPPRATRGRTVLIVLLSVCLGILLVWRFVPAVSEVVTAPALILIGLALIAFAVPLAWRLIRRRVFWSLRSKLILTYLLIGLAPVLLFVTLVAISAYVAAGQFSIHLADTRMRQELATIATDNAARAARIARFDGPRPAGAPPRRPPLRSPIPAQAAQSPAAPPATEAVRARLRTAVFLDGAPLQPEFAPDAPTPQDRSPLPLPVWALDLPRREFRGLVLDGDDLYLVAINQRQRDDGKLVSVLTSLPVDASLMDVMAQGLGRIRMAAVMTGTTRNPNPRPGFNRRDPIPVVDPALKQARATQAARDAQPTELGRNLRRTSVYGGAEPPPVNFADISVPFISTEAITDWDSGEHDNIPIEVDSRPSRLYGQLFGSSVSGIVTSYIRYGLIVLCVIFALIEALALWFAMRLSHAITGSVAALYEATQHVDRGDVDYRIPTPAAGPGEEPDQLAELANSFNTMTASLGRLLLERQEKERMQSELSIAQEVQANLFPKQGHDLPTLQLHGVCRPARAVSGDYYDFLVFRHEHNGQHANGNPQTAGNHSGVGIALGDISGKGISAALLMATLHSAVRAYRFASEDLVYTGALPTAASLPSPANPPGPGASPAGDSGRLFASPGRLLSLLNRHLYRSTQPEKYATLFLAHYDVETAHLTYSNAGQLPPLVLGRDGEIRRLDRGGTVVGLFDGMRYEEGSFEMQPGDIMVAYSDGVTEPENDFGDFGEDRLMEVVARYRDQPLHVISAQVMHALDSWIGASEQPDDITLVLARQL